jgi:hypothetical protein
MTRVRPSLSLNPPHPPEISLLSCCEQLEEDGKPHAIALTLQYTNADPKSGNYSKDASGNVPPVEYKIGYLDLSPSQFKAISDAPKMLEEGVDLSPYSYDYVMAVDGNKYSFGIKSRKPRWTLDPKLAAEVEEACQKYVQDGGRSLSKHLGKKTSLLEWKQLLAGAAAGSAEQNLDDIEN